MVIVGIEEYSNNVIQTINKGVITVFSGSIHIGLRVYDKRLLKRLLWYKKSKRQIFMMIPITNRSSIFGLFYVVSNSSSSSSSSEIVVRLIEDDEEDNPI